MPATVQPTTEASIGTTNYRSLRYSTSRSRDDLGSTVRHDWRSAVLPDLRPGEATTLYDGDGDLLVGEATDPQAVPASVRVYFAWHAGLRVEAEAEGVPRRVLFADEPLTVSLPEARFALEGFSTHSQFSGSSISLSGSLSHVVAGDEAAPLTRIEFGLANLPSASLFDEPVEVAVQGWILQIDAVEDYRDRIAVVRESGDGALTHQANLRRADDTAFTWTDAADILGAVGWVATFVAGTRVPVVFPTGVGVDGQVALREWGNVRRSRFGGVLSWCGDFQRAEALQALLPAVLDEWSQPSRRRQLRVALEFWLDAQLGSSLETRLVAAVAGLELMAWDWLVDIDCRDPSKVDGQPTAWRFRTMLRLIGLPAAVPPHMHDVARSWPGVDGPSAVADLRNRIVHPKDLDQLFQVHPTARHDVLRLATWYLEMSLLRRLGYTGRHLARIGQLPIFAGEGDPVPWAAEAEVG